MPAEYEPVTHCGGIRGKVSSPVPEFSFINQPTSKQPAKTRSSSTQHATSQNAGTEQEVAPKAGVGNAGISVLRERNFRLYYVGIWFSTTAFWVLKIAIGWGAWELSHSAFWTGIVAASYLLPAVVLSPLFGVLADRIRLKRGVQSVVVAQTLIGLVMSAGFAADLLTVQLLAALAMVHGLIAAAYHPMRLTLVGRLVARWQIAAAAGLASIAFNTARVLGPALAGLLLARFGTAIALLVGALLYLPYLLLFSFVYLRTRVRQNKPWIGEFLSGLRYARQMPVMLPVITMSLLNGIVGRALFELLPAISGGALNAGANGLAIMTAAAGAGAVIAGLTVTRFDLSIAQRLSALSVSVALCCAATLCTGLSKELILAAIFCAVAGFSTSYSGITSQSILQISLQDEYRGRVMSLWTTVSFGAPAIGALVMGAMGEVLGTGAAVGLVAAVGLIVTLALIAGYRRLFGGNYPENYPDSHVK